MWARTYGIDRWMPAKHVDRLTAKLVVVNVVKLHFTKFKKAFVDLSARLKGNSKSTSSYLLRLYWA